MLFDRIRSRLDIPAIRTIFGLKNRPHRSRKDGPPTQEIVTGETTVRAELVPHQLRAAAAESLYQGRAGTARSPSPGPAGVTVAEHASRVRQLTGQDGYTTRQAAYDLRKLRGKQLISKPGRTRRYHVPPDSARVIAAALTLRDHVIAPILAGVRSPRMGRKPSIWTAVDRDYENLRVSMQTRFRHVGIDTITATA